MIVTDFYEDVNQELYAVVLSMSADEFKLKNIVLIDKDSSLADLIASARKGFPDAEKYPNPKQNSVRWLQLEKWGRLVATVNSRGGFTAVGEMSADTRKIFGRKAVSHYERMRRQKHS